MASRGPAGAPRSHLWPRTRDGRVAVLAFLVTMALAQPPIVYWVNRIEVSLFGMPLLYVWLLGAYSLMIAVLLWAWRRGV